MRNVKVNWITANNYGKPKWHSFSRSLKGYIHDKHVTFTAWAIAALFSEVKFVCVEFPHFPVPVRE